MEKIIVVEKTEIKQGSKGEYLTVFPIDGKPVNIFDQSLWGLFNEGMAVKLKLEKSGRWMNVVGAESVARELAEKEPVKPQPSGYKGRDEDKVDRRTFVMEIGEDWRAGKRKDNDVLVLAREAFLLDWANAEGDKDETKTLAKSKSDKETPVDQVEQPPLKPARADDRAGGEAPEWAVWLWGKVKEGGWKSKTLIQYLNNTFSLTLDLEQNIEEACLQLTPSQRQLFFGELELRLKNKED